MTAPLTPAQLDGIRARVASRTIYSDTAPTDLTRDSVTLLDEVDRLRDYADTIDDVNANLTAANWVHRQRIRDVLALADGLERDPGEVGPLILVAQDIRRAAGVGQPTRSVPGTTERLLMAHRLVGGSRCACGWDAMQAHAEHEWHLEAVLDQAGLLR